MLGARCVSFVVTNEVDAALDRTQKRRRSGSRSLDAASSRSLSANTSSRSGNGLERAAPERYSYSGFRAVRISRGPIKTRIRANAFAPCAVLPSFSQSVVPVDDTIEELVARVLRGEPRAFETIVRQHLRSAYVVALAVLRRPTDAEDVAQEALIVALERIDTLRDPKQFRSWLLRIVRNQAFNWRSRRRLRDLGGEAPAESAHDASPPDALAFRFRLLEAMAVLGPTEREVVLLHDLEGWTHPEIAETLAISVMSRQHLFQARRKLRTHLDPPNQDVDHE